MMRIVIGSFHEVVNIFGVSSFRPFGLVRMTTQSFKRETDRIVVFVGARQAGGLAYATHNIRRIVADHSLSLP